MSRRVVGWSLMAFGLGLLALGCYTLFGWESVFISGGAVLGSGAVTVGGRMIFGGDT